jgi:hypothetical protein
MRIEPTNRLTTAIVKYLARVTPRCHDMTRLISQAQETVLPLATRVKMRLHYIICVWCGRYRDQLGLMKKALHECDDHPPEKPKRTMSAETKDRLKEALRNSS